MRTCITIVGIAFCVWQAQGAQAQVRGFVPGLNAPHCGTSVHSAYNHSLAQREPAAGLHGYYGALPDRDRTGNTRESIRAKEFAHCAHKHSMAQSGLAVGLPVYYGAFADQDQAGAVSEPNEAEASALAAPQAEAGVRRDVDRLAMVWPAELDEKQFTADREAADQLLLAWTISPNGFRNVDKQRLRAALVSLRVKLKRSPTAVPPTDFKAADKFLNSVARTVLGPRATLD